MESGSDKIIKGQEVVKFYLYPNIHADYFMFTNNSVHVKKVTYKEIKSKLISKAEANQKVHDYLEIKALQFEKETGLKGNSIRNTPYNFDDYFNEIYIYEKIDEECGYLYKVNWKYAIE